MEKGRIEHFKKKLLKEKRRVYDLLDQMKQNETINLDSEIASELSLYDNHPADTGGDENDRDRGRAFKENEITILGKIEDALTSIEEGTYGRCQRCENDITEERLEFIPYAQYCVACQKTMNDAKPREKNNRAIEESVLGRPFGYGYNDFGDDVEFDAEDSYQSVEKFNRIQNVAEFYEGDEEYVEPIEKISNEQYRAQLPD